MKTREIKLGDAMDRLLVAATRWSLLWRDARAKKEVLKTFHCENARPASPGSDEVLECRFVLIENGRGGPDYDTFPLDESEYCPPCKRKIRAYREWKMALNARQGALRTLRSAADAYRRESRWRP